MFFKESSSILIRKRSQYSTHYSFVFDIFRLKFVGTSFKNGQRIVRIMHFWKSKPNKKMNEKNEALWKLVIIKCFIVQICYLKLATENLRRNNFFNSASRQDENIQIFLENLSYAKKRIICLKLCTTKMLSQVLTWSNFIAKRRVCTLRNRDFQLFLETALSS